MTIRTPRVVAGSAVAAALTAGLALVAPAHAATSAPPWEPDPSAVGTITFYDATGAAVTSGSTSSGPFAAYAVGSAAPRTGDAQAQLLFANPTPTGTPVTWFKETAGSYNSYPLTTGPTAIQTLSQTKPVVAGGSTDVSLDAFEGHSQVSTATGYAHVVQVRLRTANANGQAAPTYDDADLLVDPTAHTWTEIYPTDGGGTTPPPEVTPTTLIIAATAATVNYGSTTTIEALLRDSSGNRLAGQVINLEQRVAGAGGYSLVRPVTTTSTGTAAVAVRPSANVQFYWSFPGTSTFGHSASPAAAISVAHVITGVVNHTSIHPGQTAQFYGAVSPIHTGEKVYLQQLSGSTYRNTKTVATVKRQKLPNGTTAYGYYLPIKIFTKATYTFRAYVASTTSLRYAVSVAHTVKVA